MEASNAQRIPSNAKAGDVLQLRGNVELTMIPRPAAAVPRRRAGQESAIPRSAVVLHADGVDYNQKTGEIHTHGKRISSSSIKSPEGSIKVIQSLSQLQAKVPSSQKLWRSGWLVDYSAAREWSLTNCP